MPSETNTSTAKTSASRRNDTRKRVSRSQFPGTCEEKVGAMNILRLVATQELYRAEEEIKKLQNANISKQQGREKAEAEADANAKVVQLMEQVTQLQKEAGAAQEAEQKAKQKAEQVRAAQEAEQVRAAREAEKEAKLAAERVRAAEEVVQQLRQKVVETYEGIKGKTYSGNNKKRMNWLKKTFGDWLPNETAPPNN